MYACTAPTNMHACTNHCTPPLTCTPSGWETAPLSFGCTHREWVHDPHSRQLLWRPERPPQIVCGCAQLLAGSMPAHTHTPVQNISGELTRILGWHRGGALTCGGCVGLLSRSLCGGRRRTAHTHRAHTSESARKLEPARCLGPT